MLTEPTAATEATEGAGAPADLTRRIEAALARKNASIDLAAGLAGVLAPLGMTAADAGGEVSFTGADPVLPSALALASAPAIGLVAKSVAVAKLWQARGGSGQDISIDVRTAPHRACPFYDRKWEKMNGLVPGSGHDPEGTGFGWFFRTSDGRFVHPMALYPRLKTNMLKLLRATDSMQSIANQVAKWQSHELEEAAAEAGVIMPVVRTVEEFLAHPQYRDVLSQLPLVTVTKIGDSAPEPLPGGAAAPFSGLRALGHAHVIAGAGIGRTLALHGADVLNVWRENEYELPFLYHTANVGVRSTTLNLNTMPGYLKMNSLLKGADIFYANRRPAYLAMRGLAPAQVAEVRPGIIHVEVSLHGQKGPWANHAGFDQTAGAVIGMAMLEGSSDAPQLSVTTVVNDWMVPWLATTGIVSALLRRAEEGGSYTVHVSLTRVALWILSLGLFDRGYANQVIASGDKRHRYTDPEVFSQDTPLGRYEGVTDQVRMSRTPGAYPFALAPQGAARPEWTSGPR